MAPTLSKLLLLGVAASPVRASSIAAWWNGYGAQVLLLNETNNQIRYSACNSQDDPRYSYTDGNVLSLSHRPKSGTPLAGVGWYDETKTIASIFYMDDQGNIANSLLNCNMSTGLFESQGNWIVSNGAPSIHSNSGLAAVVLNETAGYRVYYHNSDGAISELTYHPNVTWEYSGIISQDINSLPALAAAFSGNSNITVASARDQRNIAVTRFNKDGSWFRSTLPHPLQGNLTTADTDRTDIAVNETTPTNFTLSGWDGKTGALGVSIDSLFTRSIWYIGNDSNLYWVANQNFTWSQRANQSTAFWPQADEPNADLAVAYDFKSSMVRIYYMVKGQLSQVKYESNVWKAWSTVAAPDPLPTQPSTATPTDSSNSSADSGLSTGAKAGIGVGVSLGAIALGAIIAVIVLIRRKKQPSGFEHPPYPDEGSTTLGPDTPAPSYGSPVAASEAAKYEQYAWDQKNNTPDQQQPFATAPDQQQHVQQLDGTTRSELYAPQLYELPAHNGSHELMAAPPQQRHQ